MSPLQALAIFVEIMGPLMYALACAFVMCVLAVALFIFWRAAKTFQPVYRMRMMIYDLKHLPYRIRVEFRARKAERAARKTLSPTIARWSRYWGTRRIDREFMQHFSRMTRLAKRKSAA